MMKAMLVAVSSLSPEAVAALENRSSVVSTQSSVDSLARLWSEDQKNPELLDAFLRSRYFLAEFQPKRRHSDFNKETVEIALTFFRKRLGKAKLGYGELVRRIEGLPRAWDGALFWTTLSFGRTIKSRFILSRAGAARDFHRMLEALVRRSPEVMYCGPRRVLSAYLSKAPRYLGGTKSRALKQAQLAVAESPQFAGNYVALVEVQLAQGFSRDEKLRAKMVNALRKAIELPQLPRHAQPEQSRSKAQAQELLQELLNL